MQTKLTSEQVAAIFEQIEDAQRVRAEAMPTERDALIFMFEA